MTYYRCPEGHFSSGAHLDACPHYDHGSPCGAPLTEVTEAGNPRRKVKTDA